MDENILIVYKKKIDRLEEDNKRLRKENTKMSRILEAIKMFFIV